VRQKARRLVHRRRDATGQHAQEQREDHHAHPIVEQRFPGNHQFEFLRCMGGLEDAHHGDRIGRRDQGTEQQAMDQRQLQAQQREGVPHPVTHGERRQHRAQHGQHRHRPAVDLELLEVDVQRAGKEQERQHPLHQRVREVDGMHQRFLVLPKVVNQSCDAGCVQPDQRQ
jgi:hypothetical protein